MKKTKTLYASLAAAAALATGLTISPTVSTAAPVDAPAAGPSTARIQNGSSDSHLVWATTKAKVYSEQDTSSDVLGTLNKGDHVGTRDTSSGQPGGDSGWVPVTYHGQNGFVLGQDVVNSGQTSAS